MMKTVKITILFILCGCVAFSQTKDYAFKVLANKGSNEMKSGADWVPIKTGVSLKSGDELRLSGDAYLGLVHVSGKPLEVKKSGSYQVAMLESQVKTGTGVLTKYTDFILSSNSPETKKSKLSATGAVNRGETYSIKVRLPENQHSGIFNNEAIVTWDGAIAGPYVITLRNMFDDELNKFETMETSFRIDLSEPKYAKENAVLVEVRSKADPNQVSKSHMIKRLAPLEQAGVKKSLGEITGDVTEETALNKFILAGFYEQNNLLIDAIVAYEQAIQLAPDVATYKEAYDEFLSRQAIR